MDLHGPPRGCSVGERSCGQHILDQTRGYLRGTSFHICRGPQLTLPRAQIEEYFGIKRSTSPFITIKTAHSFIRLSLKNALPGYLSRMRRRPRNSSRKWMIGKKMRARTPKPHRSKGRGLSYRQGTCLMESRIAALEDWEVSCMDNDLLQLRTYNSRPFHHSRRSLLVNQPAPTALVKKEIEGHL